MRILRNLASFCLAVAAASGCQADNPNYGLDVGVPAPVDSGAGCPLYAGNPGATSSLAPAAAILKQIQTGTVTVARNGSVSATVRAVAPERSFLWFQTRHASNRPTGVHLRGRLSSPTTLEFTRATDEATPPPMEVRYYLLEFASGVRVQRGMTPQSATAVDVTLPVPLASTQQAFVHWSKSANPVDNDWGRNDPVLVDIKDLTTVRVRAGEENPLHEIAWELVELTSGADLRVQRGSSMLVGSQLIHERPLPTPVDPKRSLIISSFQAASAGRAIGSHLPRVELVNGGAVRAVRETSGGGSSDISELSWQVLEWGAGTRVLSGTANLAMGVAQLRLPLPSPIDPQRSAALASTQTGGGQNVGSTPYAVDDLAGVCSVTLELERDTLVLQRAATQDRCQVSWFVLEFLATGTSNVTGPPEPGSQGCPP